MQEMHIVSRIVGLLQVIPLQVVCFMEIDCMKHSEHIIGTDYWWCRQLKQLYIIFFHVLKLPVGP